MTDYEKSFVTPEYSTKLLYKMSDLWNKECLCDAILKVGEAEMKLHKLVLISASPLLASHSNDISEKILTVTLEIDGDVNALQQFLSYLYYGTLHLTEDNVSAIETVARLLKVEEVVNFCVQFRELFSLPHTEEKDDIDDIEMGPTIEQNTDNFGITLGQSAATAQNMQIEKDHIVLDDFHEGAGDDGMQESEYVEDDDNSEESPSLICNPVGDTESTLTIASVDLPSEVSDPENKDDSEREVSNGNQEACQQCEKKFSSKTALKRHMMMHEKKFKCSKCTAAFQHNCRLREHMEKHKTDRPFQCPTCNKTFRDAQWMKEHVRFFHEGKTPYHCEICNERFIRKVYRDNHYYNKHYKITLPTCKACGKSFSHEEALKKHQAHCFSEGGINHCSSCDKYFRNPKLLKLHNKNVHSDSKYICKACGKEYKTASGLSKHEIVCASEKVKHKSLK